MNSRREQLPRLHRCAWGTEDPLYLAYHDQEWGVPVHDDRLLYEFLVLEGMQAGLSWLVVLRKREDFRRAFSGFDPKKVARFGREKVKRLLSDERLIRNRLKVEAAVINARAFLAVGKEFGSFDAYIWAFVGGRPLQNRWKTPRQIPVQTPSSAALSQDMRRRGFRFVGPTICYAFMQAVGLVNDHTVRCFRHREVARMR